MRYSSHNSITLLFLLVAPVIILYLNIEDCGYAIEVACPEEIIGEVNIRVSTDITINDNFYGFGAETLPWLWNQENAKMGVTEADLRLNAERIMDMGLDLTRIFVPWEMWNPSVDYKTFTWESDDMRSLYQVLDIYQKMDTDVIVVTVDWLERCPWKNVESSAESVAQLLEHLIKAKGYTCIKFWTLTNEPDKTYGWMRKANFQDYIEIHELVRQKMADKEIPIRIIGSDDTENKVWFEKTVKLLDDTVDVYSSHRYFSLQDIPLIPHFFDDRIGIIREFDSDGEAEPLFLCEFGFKGEDFGTFTNSFMGEYDYGMLTAELAIDALNHGVDGASIWTLHEIYLGEFGCIPGNMMRIGLWGYKDEDWQPRPVFYAYSLFTKYIERSSRVLKTESQYPLYIKTACIEHNGKKSLFIVNKTQSSQNIIVRGFESGLKMRRYLYSKARIPTEDQRMLRPDKQVKIKDFLKDTIPPQSVILYTNF